MVAIMTKYIGPTNTRGARIKAYTCTGLTKTVDWRDDADIEENHARAVLFLANKYGWLNKNVMVSGATSTGYAFVMIPRCGVTFDAIGGACAKEDVIRYEAHA